MRTIRSALQMFVAAITLTTTLTPATGAASEPDVLVESQTTTVTVHPDGRMSTRVDRTIRVNTFAGSWAVADVRIPFDSNLEVVEVHTAQVTTPSGQTVTSDKRTQVVVTNDAVAPAPSFLSTKDYIIVLPGIEIGSVVTISYTRRDIQPWRMHFEALVPVGDLVPIRSSIVSFRVSADLPISIRGFDLPAQGFRSLEPQHNKADTVWSYELTDYTPSGPLPAGPQAPVPTLLFTTARNPEELLDPLADRLAESQESRLGTIMLAEITDDLRPTMTPGPAYVGALAFGLACRLQPVPGSMLAGRWPPRPLDQVWLSRDATPVEASLLLQVLLEAAGHKTELVWTAKPSVNVMTCSTQSNGDSRTLVPALFALEGPVVLVRDEYGHDLCFSGPAFAPCRFKPADEPGLVLTSNGKVASTTGTRPPRSNDLNIDVRFERQKTAMVTTVTYQGSGAFSLWSLGLAELSDAAIRRHFGSPLLSGNKMTGFSVAQLSPDESVVTVVFEAPIPTDSKPLVLDPFVSSALVESFVQPLLADFPPPIAGPLTSVSWRVTFSNLRGSVFSPFQANYSVQGPQAEYAVASSETGPDFVLTRKLKLIPDENKPAAASQNAARSFFQDNTQRLLLMP